MKNYKKLLSIALAMAMTTAMAVPGFADTTTTPIDSVNDVNKNYSITINNSETGHTYEVYQILVGDIYGTTTTDDENGTVDTTGTLSNIRWGSSITEAGKAELLGENTDWSAADYAKTLKSESDAIDMAATLNADDEYLGNFVGSDSTPEEGKYVIENLVPGYYLIKDASESLAEETDVYTSYIVQLLGFVVMEPKNTIDDSTPQNVAKYVTDINDSTGNSAEKQDSADYDIGDEVPFLLSATVPEKFDDFDVYKLTFYDNLDDHFAVPEDDDITVKAGEVPLTKDTDYTIKRTGLPEGYDFAIVFADLHEVNGVSADTVITVEYSAELKSNAVIGAGGNVNSMYVEYSNNPNDETGEETGKSVQHDVKVYTYQLTVNKVNEENELLPGAGFTLYKWDPEADNGKNDGTKGAYVSVGTEQTGVTTFKFKGLDDGKYKLSETTTPPGYNTAADVEFEIIASHTATELTSVSVTNSDVTANDGELATTIVNYTGTTLPSTGGIGTTVFYAAGIILMAGAVFFIVRRKRA